MLAILVKETGINPIENQNHGGPRSSVNYGMMVRLAERQFLLAKKNNNNISIILDKRNYYQYAVKLFDKYYIKSKRKNYCERHNHIAETETKNPKTFGKLLKILVPEKP